MLFLNQVYLMFMHRYELLHICVPIRSNVQNINIIICLRRITTHEIYVAILHRL